MLQIAYKYLVLIVGTNAIISQVKELPNLHLLALLYNLSCDKVKLTYSYTFKLDIKNSK